MNDLHTTQMRAALLLGNGGPEMLDVDRRMRKRTPGALVGYEMMTDVCHTQPGVRPVLMADFVVAVLVASSYD